MDHLINLVYLSVYISIYLSIYELSQDHIFRIIGSCHVKQCNVYIMSVD